MIGTRRWAALLCLSLTAGCYEYVTSDLTAVPNDAYVRVYLSRRGMGDVPREIPSSTTYLTGRIVAVTRDSILIQVPVSRSIEGNGARDLAQNVYLPIGEVISVDRRRFSPGRTGLAMVAGVGFVSATVLGISS